MTDDTATEDTATDEMLTLPEQAADKDALPDIKTDTEADTWQGTNQDTEQPSPQTAAFIALVQGKPLIELPQDLYIPPDALEVILEAFEGPLDLLLYLIRKHNLDILNIPIAEITRQYMEYIHLMKELRLELAAEYLVMAATLAEIKSRMLLPRPPEAEAEEEDPRAKLIRQLQEYERFKKAAEDLDKLPRLDRDIFTVKVAPPQVDVPQPKPQFDIQSLVGVFIDILQRSDMVSNYTVEKEVLSVREKMSMILERLSQEASVTFSECFDLTEGKVGVVVTFLAVLELAKLFLIEVIQTHPFGMIHLKAVTHEENT